MVTIADANLSTLNDANFSKNFTKSRLPKNKVLPLEEDKEVDSEEEDFELTNGIPSMS
jgi:hypothetical protein